MPSLEPTLLTLVGRPCRHLQTPERLQPLSEFRIGHERDSLLRKQQALGPSAVRLAQRLRCSSTQRNRRCQPSIDWGSGTRSKPQSLAQKAHEKWTRNNILLFFLFLEISRKPNRSWTLTVHENAVTPKHNARFSIVTNLAHISWSRLIAMRGRAATAVTVADQLRVVF
jgi:hypothetical protein